MQVGLMVLQVVGVVLAVVVGMWLAFRKGSFVDEGYEGIAPEPQWYKTAQVETGILEVAVAVTAGLLALPLLSQPARQETQLMIAVIRIFLFLAAVVSTVATFWLYGIYVQQLLGFRNQEDLPAHAPNVRQKVHLSIRFGLSVRHLGPYALLAYAMLALLLGLGLSLPILTV